MAIAALALGACGGGPGSAGLPPGPSTGTVGVGATSAPGGGTTAAPGSGSTAAPGTGSTTAPSDGTTAIPGGGATATPGGNGTSAPSGGGTGVPTPFPSTTPVGASADERNCLWTVDTNTSELNTLFPDTNAYYFQTNVAIPPGGDVRFDGVYPHSRYISFNVYNPLLQPTDALNDTAIGPNGGSTDVFLPGGNRAAAVSQRAYSLTLIASPPPSDPTKRAPNTLYGGQSLGSTGMSSSMNQAVIIYRVYVPDRGFDNTGGVGLPHITFEMADGTKVTGAEACHAPPPLPNAALVPDPLSDLPANTTAFKNLLWLKFFDLQSSEASRTYLTPAGPAVYELVGSPTTGGGGFASNADNRYITANTSESLGNVVAIHGDFPRTPITSDGRSPMGTGDMRYWSICTNNGDLTTVYACIFDEQLIRDPSGGGIVLVSMAADRPANAVAACGVTWLDWGATQNGVLIFRNMLPQSQAVFPHAIQYVPGPPGANEQSTMGAYYPYGTHMMRADFESLGCPVSAAKLPTYVQTPP